MSIEPCASTAASNATRTSSRRRGSPASATASSPTDEAAARAVSPSRSKQLTRAPAAASVRTHALPMSSPTPATNACFPLSPKSSTSAPGLRQAGGALLGPLGGLLGALFLERLGGLLVVVLL